MTSPRLARLVGLCLLGACEPAALLPDAERADAGGDDGGTADAGRIDERPDAGPLDAGPLDTGPLDTGRATTTGPFFTYTFEDRVHRIEARVGASAEDVSARLERFGAGARDRWLVPSANGAWLALSTDRLPCPSAGECLALAPADLSSLEAVRAGGADVGIDGTPAVGDGGDLVVYPGGGGPHTRDVWVTRRVGAAWGAPVLLTEASERAYNGSPALSLDGARVLFDCGASPYPEGGDTDVCEVGVDGTGLRVLVRPSAMPGAREPFLQFPHDSIDGVLFQASWPLGAVSPETIWLLPTAGPGPTPIGRALDNAVSPCALHDGRWGALWLGRPGNPSGAHELALLARDGTLEGVLTPGIDVTDIGIGCGGG